MKHFIVSRQTDRRQKNVLNLPVFEELSCSEQYLEYVKSENIQILFTVESLERSIEYIAQIVNH